MFEKIKSIGAAYIASDDNGIQDLGTLNQFQSVQRKGNAMLCDGIWIPIYQKCQSDEASLSWQVISYTKDGEERLACGKRNTAEGWTVLK